LVVDFGACKAVIRLLIDLSHINHDPIRYELLSARGIDRKQSSGDASAEYGESFEPEYPNRTQRLLLQVNERSRRIERKICVGSPVACRLCLACSNMRGVVERTVPYPRLLPAPAFVDPLWARHGGCTRNSTARACIGRHRHVSRRAIGLVGSGNAMPDFPSRGRTDRDARRHVVAHGRLRHSGRLGCARAPLTLPRRRGGGEVH